VGVRAREESGWASVCVVKGDGRQGSRWVTRPLLLIARLDEGGAVLASGAGQVRLSKAGVGEAGDGPGAQLRAGEEADVSQVPGTKALWAGGRAGRHRCVSHKGGSRANNRCRCVRCECRGRQGEVCVSLRQPLVSRNRKPAACSRRTSTTTRTHTPHLWIVVGG
jgi:hypothetical protein